MAIRLPHFDTKTRTDLDLVEEIELCMAHYLFPETSFAVGHVTAETARPFDLRPYKGHSLQFSSGERLYYANRDVGEELFPKPSDRSAYGSLPFTPLKSLHNLRHQRVLAIDDETGDSGGVIADRDFAKTLVGDCWGKMSFDLARQVTGNDTVPFQFRLGIRPQTGNEAYRIAKGTLAPDARLNALGGSIDVSAIPEVARELNLGQYDLILATSMFKGRKGGEAIAPGTYLLDVGLGVKSEANYGRQRLGVQVLVNYPKGIEADVIPKLREKVQALRESLAEPYLIAQQFVDYYEEKIALRQTLDEETSYLSALLDALLGDDQPGVKSKEEALYRLLKTDLEHHGQLLEHPYVLSELKSFVQSRWQELGFSGGVKFNSAMAQPCAELGKSEICAPNLPDGVELIVTRSPLVNSNGVILLTNRHVPHLMRIDGCIHINPATASRHLQADFDGDRLAYEQASKYPALAEEIREKLSPQQRYPDVIKRDKVSYQGSFEEIAIQCASNDIGTIANQIMRATAIYNDTLARPEGERPHFVQRVGTYYAKQIELIRKGVLALPESYLVLMREVVRVGRLATPSSEAIEHALMAIRAIQRSVVTDLANELQVAVDGPKSAARPDLELFASRKAASNCVEVAFLKEKVDKEVFNTRSARLTTYSPIDSMLREVNNSFEQISFEHRPAHTFRQLHPQPDPETLDIAVGIRNTYNNMLSRASKMRQALERDPEKGNPYLLLGAATGTPISVTQLDAFGVVSLFDGDTTTAARIIPRPEGVDIPNPLVVEAEAGGTSRIIGAVSIQDTEEFGVRPTSHRFTATLSPRAAITEYRVDGAWRELDTYVTQLSQHYTAEERQVLAGALWWLSHTKDEYGNKKALAAVRLFPDEALKPLEKLQFTSLTLVGLQYSKETALLKELRSGRAVTCEIVEQEIPGKDGPTTRRGIAVEGTFVAPLQQESPSYALGAIFQGSFAFDPPSKVRVQLPGSAHLTVTQVKNYAHASHIFDGEEVTLQFGILNDTTRNTTRVLAFIDGQPLGILDRGSEQLLKQSYGTTPVSFVAPLQSPASNTAKVSVDPESLVHPWQLEKRSLDRESLPAAHLEREALREQLFEVYSDYAKNVLSDDPTLRNGPTLDREIARRAFDDGMSLQDVTAIISTSPAITRHRPILGSPEWNSYQEMAREYVVKLCESEYRIYQEVHSREISR